MKAEHSPPAEAPTRGLYIDDMTGPHGETSYTLVDRRGHAIVRVQVAQPVDTNVVGRALLDLLEDLDPVPAQPRLELMK